MIEELGKPKGSGKDNFNFTKTVQPILDNFKKQLIADKKKMQKQLNDDIAAIHKCIKEMKKSARLGLLELDGKKDVDSILKLIKQWNRQKVLKKDCKLDKGETK